MQRVILPLSVFLLLCGMSLPSNAEKRSAIEIVTEGKGTNVTDSSNWGDIEASCEDSFDESGYRDQILECLRAEDMGDKTELKGSVTAEFELDPKGTITNVTIISSALPSPKMEACFVQVFRGLPLPGCAGSSRLRYKGDLQRKKQGEPWSGTTVTYSNFAKIQTTYDYNASRCSNAGTNPGQPVSIDADSCSETDLGNNYDPYYGMSVSLRPAWRLDNGISLSARFDVTGELTTPNATNRRVMMGDLSFSSSFGNLYTIPGADIGVSASTSVAFGTSPYSLAAGKIGGVSGSLTMSRAFEVLEGLNVSYTLSTGHDVYTHSSGSTLSHVLLTDCSSDGDNTDDREPDCDGEQEVYNGVPNKWMRLSQTLSASLQLTEMFSLSAYYLAAYGFQYDTVDNSEISNGVDDPTTMNFSNGAGFTLSAAVLPYLSVRSGVRSNHPQLDPNSQYYTPLFNRFAQWFLDVTLVPASLVAEL